MWDFLDKVSRVLALNERSYGSNCSRSRAWVVSINIFMNLVKMFLEVEGTKSGVKAFGGVAASVKVLLLQVLDLLAEP